MQNESDTARNLKNMLVTLKFQKPPNNIAVDQLFSRVETKLSEVLKTVPPEFLGKPLIDVELSAKQWEKLADLQEEMRKEYTIRRDMLLKRLDVTVQSFLVRINIAKSEFPRFLAYTTLFSRYDFAISLFTVVRQDKAARD